MEEPVPQTNDIDVDKSPTCSRCELKSIEHRHSKRGEQERIERDEGFANWQKKFNHAYSLVAEQFFNPNYQHEKTTFEWGDLARLVDNYDADGLVGFKLLWTIFRPGDLIYQNENGHERLYRLDQTSYQEHSTAGPYFKLGGLYIYFDGYHVGFVKKELRIYQSHEFAGEKASKIQGLNVYPMRYRTETKALKERLIERGHRFLNMQEAKLWYNHGLFLYLEFPPDDYYDEDSSMDGMWLPRTETGRVMIDFKTFSEEARLQVQTVQSWESISSAVKREHTLNPLEADPLLCPPYAYGYSLSGKTWCKIFLDNLKPVHWKINVMEELILPVNAKRIVKALVNFHQFPDRARDEGTLKGKGLTMLLHGPPGSGKTMTAAIVLIDEADVFLEARKSTGANRFEQNSMVAVFLRQLQFFQGILFLTSNRVAVFDEAITSRIHLIPEYQSLNRASRAHFWQHYLTKLNNTYYSDATVIKRLSKSESDLSSEAEIAAAAEKLSVHEMNGREISNSVTTARTLAEDETERLKFEHLEIIVGVWEDFNISLRRLQRWVSGKESKISGSFSWK
ncbi:MAG: hypothetical protein Q9225_000343 [Loekoesia sp. 1 TL-2023]